MVEIAFTKVEDIAFTIKDLSDLLMPICCDAGVSHFWITDRFRRSEVIFATLGGAEIGYTKIGYMEEAN